MAAALTAIVIVRPNKIARLNRFPFITTTFLSYIMTFLYINICLHMLCSMPRNHTMHPPSLVNKNRLCPIANSANMQSYFSSIAVHSHAHAILFRPNLLAAKRFYLCILLITAAFIPRPIASVCKNVYSIYTSCIMQTELRVYTPPLFFFFIVLHIRGCTQWKIIIHRLAV